MNTTNSFHEVRFPTGLALGATGGPERRTEVVTMASGMEQRNARWAHSRRKFNAGYGIKTISDLQEVIEFFEERRGRLFGFRFRDPFDWKSCKPTSQTSPLDQLIGIGDGVLDGFQLAKQYGSAELGYSRKISKPVAGSVTVSVAQTAIDPADYQVDYSTGAVTFAAAAIPQPGEEVRAGFEFDIPVRFDSDELAVNLKNFEVGDIPSIPIVELFQ